MTNHFQSGGGSADDSTKNELEQIKSSGNMQQMPYQGNQQNNEQEQDNEVLIEKDQQIKQAEALIQRLMQHITQQQQEIGRLSQQCQIQQTQFEEHAQD